VTNLEAITAFRISHLDIDPLHLRGGRALMQLVDELLDGMFVALNMRLDTAIRSIPHPADNSKRSCLFGGPGAEEDALHPAGRAGFAGHAHRQRPSFTG